jgi:hypothetical protein
MEALLNSLLRLFKVDLSPCCNAQIRDCYLEMGYKKTECSACHAVLQRLEVI